MLGKEPAVCKLKILKLSTSCMLNYAKALPSGGMSLITSERKLFHSCVILAKLVQSETDRGPELSCRINTQWS